MCAYLVKIATAGVISHASSRRQHFTLLPSCLWILHSFQPLPGLCGKAEDLLLNIRPFILSWLHDAST